MTGFGLPLPYNSDAVGRGSVSGFLQELSTPSGDSDLMTAAENAGRLLERGLAALRVPAPGARPLLVAMPAVELEASAEPVWDATAGASSATKRQHLSRASNSVG